MKNKKVFWQILRGMGLLFLLLSLYVFIVFGNWWFEIVRFPFNIEGNYFDPISGISYHNGPFFAASGQFIFSIISLCVSLASFFFYKWATIKSKGY
jgi:hypothetical protein